MTVPNDRFAWKTGDLEVSQCLFCTRWERGSCLAFPDGIPYAILANQANHTRPYPNDHGIMFDPKSKEAEEAQRLIFDRRREETLTGVKRIPPKE